MAHYPFSSLSLQTLVYVLSPQLSHFLEFSLVCQHSVKARFSSLTSSSLFFQHAASPPACHSSMSSSFFYLGVAYFCHCFCHFGMIFCCCDYCCPHPWCAFPATYLSCCHLLPSSPLLASAVAIACFHCRHRLLASLPSSTSMVTIACFCHCRSRRLLLPSLLLLPPSIVTCSTITVTIACFHRCCCCHLLPPSPSPSPTSIIAIVVTCFHYRYHHRHLCDHCHHHLRGLHCRHRHCHLHDHCRHHHRHLHSHCAVSFEVYTAAAKKVVTQHMTPPNVAVRVFPNRSTSCLPKLVGSIIGSPTAHQSSWPNQPSGPATQVERPMTQLAQWATTVAQLVLVGSPAPLDHFIGPSCHLCVLLSCFFLLTSFFTWSLLLRLLLSPLGLL